MDSKLKKTIPVGFGILLIIITVISITKKPPKITNIELGQKEIIIDQAQFIIKPIINTVDDESTITFIINLTSYQTPELLALNYKDQSILEINYTTFQSSKWEILEFTQNNLIGKLMFVVDNDMTNINEIMLKIFTFTDNKIIWTIDK